MSPHTHMPLALIGLSWPDRLVAALRPEGQAVV